MGNMLASSRVTDLELKYFGYIRGGYVGAEGSFG